MMYMSKTVTHWSSEPDKHGVYGMRNHMETRNGKGFHIHETLDRHGKPIKQTKKSIAATPAKMRKSPRRKESRKNK